MQFLDPLHQLQAVHARHADIRDHGIGDLAPQCLQQGLGVVEGAGGEAGLGQGPVQHPAQGGIVVDDPDVFLGAHALFSRGSQTVKTVSPGLL